MNPRRSGAYGLDSESAPSMVLGDVCRSVYLDNQATTRADPRVVAAMRPFWSEAFGNPHSTEHSVGWAADSAVEHARGYVASAIGADAGEVFFTSGATEANNLAILGSARAAGAHRRRIVVSAIEHRCVLGAAAAAAREGFEIVTVPVGQDGLVRMDELARAVDARTALVSIMLANNEVGTIQPIAEIAEVCRAAGALLHTDAAQGLAAMRIDVDALGADLLSLSSHKMYGPMGIGALFVRHDIHTRPEPIMHGGGQEGGLRPGTLPTPLCVGFGASCRIMEAEGEGDRRHISAMRADLLDGLSAILPGLRVNGNAASQHPGVLNVRLPGLDAEDLLARIQPRLAASTGAACSSGLPQPSHVLAAIGLTPAEARSSIRFGLGRFTSAADIESALTILREVVGARIPAP